MPIINTALNGGSSLPDQTGQNGKFLTTDGTDASWSDKPLVNNIQGSQNSEVVAICSQNSTMSYGNYNGSAIIIGKGNHGTGYGTVIAIGADSKVTDSSTKTIIVGAYSSAGYGDSIILGHYITQKSGYGNGRQITIGDYSTSTAGGTISIGTENTVSATRAIQIGHGATNSDANTFKVANANGNFELMNANGNLPADRLASTTGLVDGNYRLRLTMASGVPTLSWVAE